MVIPGLDPVLAMELQLKAGAVPERAGGCVGAADGRTGWVKFDCMYNCCVSRPPKYTAEVQRKVG